MVKHNNQVPNGHFHKDWKSRVKTWFDQAPKAASRRRKREEKAKRVFPRPVSGALRPVVRCPTVRYNRKLRLGRGFTLDELKGAGLTPQYAQTIGIAYDRRRKNRSEESLELNVQRLQEYQSRLVLFPRNKRKAAKKGEASAEEQAAVGQDKSRDIIAVPRAAKIVEFRAITDEERNSSAYATLQAACKAKRIAGKKDKPAGN
jgi:large subunit ribosomal protein L13e